MPPGADIPLPPAALRPGVASNRDDVAWTQRADDDVARLVHLVGLREDSKLLDWGCGPGRLALGIARRFGRIGLYHGVDVQPAVIGWAREHMAGPGFEWTLVDAPNARYNRDGSADPVIPAPSAGYDVLWAHSVLSHMNAADARSYLPEISRVLVPGGVAGITAFVEVDVPDETENPQGYLGRQWSGRLHCVRYERTFLTGLIEAAGLTLREVQHRSDAGGLSLILATRT